MENRIIKFRVWDKFNKKMHYHDVSHFVSLLDNGTLSTVSGFGGDNIAMQYTNRQDCLGCPIYEGDIIEFDIKEWGGDDNIHIVSWDNESSEWSWGGGSSYDMGFRTVIGSIYENPKLIKDES